MNSLQSLKDNQIAATIISDYIDEFSFPFYELIAAYSSSNNSNSSNSNNNATPQNVEQLKILILDSLPANICNYMNN